MLAYEKLPSYKKLFFSMIKYYNMYQPISFKRMEKHVIPGLNKVERNENVSRARKRAQTYMNKRKLIRAVDDEGQKRIVVTSTGEKIFYEQYPLAKLRQQKWDGTWTMVMYDFPEEIRQKRDRLREDLLKYGFGSPQISIYISPLPLAKPIQQLMEAKEYQKYVWVAKAQSVLGKSNREIAQDSWPLGIINDLYRRLEKTFVEVAGDEDLETFWKICFLAIEHKNPYLPKELLPEDWHEEACRKLFKKLSTDGFLNAIFR